MSEPEYNWITDGISTVTGFLSPEECLAHIKRAEEAGFGDAPISTGLGQVRAPEVRSNTRVMLDDVNLAASLWQRLAVFAPGKVRNEVPVGLNERFRYYRYEPWQVFLWHRDGCFERPSGERSRVTFMVYLNDDFEGGSTRFEDAEIKPQAGMALMFLHELLHEGAIVTSGRKYVLRSDIMYQHR